ncbi:MAG: rhodanese-like domain-containing protein, partial [Lachnospiraceae bacterium]|nr:rhodanese-like domain-containing protein [Lachnospiraceae bacterium]
MMKKAIKIVIAGMAVVSVIVVAIIVKQHISITSDGRSVSIIGGADGPTSVFLAGKIAGGEEQMAEYTSITMDEAKDIFMTEGDYIILDVRRADEFAEGHIPGAINVANEDILNT